MKICKFFLATLLIGSFATKSLAADLVEVYKQALQNDPKFKAARSNWLAEKENIAMTRAAFLPQIAAEGSVSRQRTQTNQPSSLEQFFNKTSKKTSLSNNAGYGLRLTQSIFNFSNLANYWKAKAGTKSYNVLFLAEEENLLLRVSEAYFQVLLAKNILHYAKKNKQAMERTFVQTKHKYDVGLASVTDLEDARTKYDLARADEIKATNNVDDNFEKLSEITKTRYTRLDSLKNNLPLLSPQPQDIDKWTKAAQEQNLELLAQRFATIAARENVKVQNAGHAPVLSAEGQYSHSDDMSGTYNKNTSGALKLSIPLFQGGYVMASAKQAGYQYQQQAAKQEEVHRQVVSQTRQNYLGILSSISRIKADRQAIKSAKSSLRATQASYSVGTRTMADVLDAQTQLYRAQREYAEDEHNYIIQLLRLKQLTGTLSIEDLKNVNSWLKNHSQKTTTKNSGKKTNESSIVVLKTGAIKAIK